MVLPLAASAESFRFERDVQVPALGKPELLLIDLDLHVREFPGTDFRVLKSDGKAVAFKRRSEEPNLMQEAILDVVPAAADTVPRTSMAMLRDGDWASFFQPATTDRLVLRFHFNRDVTPSLLKFDLRSGSIGSTRVRMGQTASTLKDAFVGSRHGERIELSRERVRVVEVTFEQLGGVVQIGELQLLEPHELLVFRAVPGEAYKLRYGTESSLQNPDDRTFHAHDVAKPTGLGAVRTLTAAQQDDHDGFYTDVDNCPLVWNGEQEDRDKDGVGDACDSCPSQINPTQEDANGNGRGDACDDNDGDGVVNAVDNCPGDKNSRQADEDSDGVGNTCDTTDDRWSERRPWLLWASMGGIILVLVGVGAMILKRAPGK